MIKDALRIADLEKQLAERTSELIQQREELAVVSSVQEALVQELDMQAIYDLVGDKIRDLFDANAIIISTFDHEAGMEVFNYAMEEGERHYVDNRPLNKLRHHLIQSRQKIVINTQQEAVEWFGDEVVPGTKYMQSGVFVPLIAAGKVTGYVSLQNVEHEYAFSEMEIRLLETLCHSMSTALQSARLLKETEQRTAELAVINSVQEGLAKELDMQAIYDLVGNRIRELFDAQVVGIATIDHLNEVEHIHFLIEKNERYYPVPRPLNTLRKHLIQTKERVLINKNFEAVASAFGMKHVPGTEPPRSALYVPLIIGDKATGYVSLQNIDRENAFSEGDVRLLETLANTMAVSLENARLFDETTRLLKETEQQKAELGVINSVQEGLAKELDIQAIYDLVGDRITKLFKAQAVVIATFDHDTSTEHFKYLMEDDQRFYLASRPYDKLRQHLIINKKKIVINTDYAEAYAKFGLRTLPGTNMTKSGVFVPLIIGDKVNSYISLQNNETENAFSEGDVRLLETLANSMSVALENARLFDETTRLLKETEQRTTELAVINSVQEGLAHELEINAIYDLVGNKIREVFNAQGVIIATFDHERGMEVFNFLFEDGERYYSEPRRYDKLRYELIMKKQSILINSDVEKAFADFGLKVVPGTAYPQSLLFVPMIVGNRVTSYVSLQNTEKEYAFNESDVRLLETLANSMSVALENARLFDETNRLLKETEDRAAELALINGIQEGLASKLEFQSIINLVGDKLTEIFNAQCTVISLYLSETREVEHRYAIERGERLDLFLQERAHPIDKFRQEVVETRKPYLINENYAHIAAKLDEATILEGDEPKSLLFMPMIVGSEVKGIISLQNLDIENAFSESDVRLLQTVVNAMSVALENARLFDETQRLLKETEQRNTELAVINSVQEGLVEQMEMQSIYDLVGNQIREIFDAQVVVIWSFDHQAGLEHSNFNLEKGVRYYPKPRHIDQLRRHLIKTKEPIMIKEDLVNTLAKYGMDGAKPIPGTEMPKSGLWVPLVVGETVKGYISLQNVDREHAFTDSDVRLLTTLANSMSVALENARLFDETNRLLKETEQRTAELAVINSVQDGLARELDIQGIYDLVGDKLCELFPDTQTLVIRTFDHQTGLEHFQYAIEKGKKLTVEPQKFMWASRILLETKKPIDIRDNYLATALSHGGKGVTTGKPPKSAVFVPMLSSGSVFGSISLQNVDREHAFSDSDIRLLTTLTNSMTVALENARLFDETNRLLKETEQRTAELAVINSVQDGLVREMDIQAIYDLVGERICALFDTQTVILRTFDLEKGLEQWKYVIEKGERLHSEPRPIIWANKEIIRTGQPLLINKNYVKTAKKFGSSGFSKGSPPKSAMFVPLKVGDEVKGSVSLQNVDRENAFSDADLRLLTTLTNSMSVALENARLFNETTVLLNESKQRAAELATVNNISKAMASLLDPKDLIQMVGDQIRDLFKANIVYLALYDANTRIIHFPYQYGEKVESREIGEGLTSKILMTGEPLLINHDVAAQSQQMGVQILGITAASYLGVPIPVGDEMIGVMSVQTTEEVNRFNENDLRLLTTIASSVGVALRNATLFEDVKKAKQQAEEATKLAEEASAAKGAFLSTVSHELRTPLTSVLGFAKIIRKRLEERIFPLVDTSDKKTERVISQIAENLQVVISEGERLTNLINDVLDLAKIEAGKMEWHQEPVSLPDIAERAIAATSALFDQKSLKLVKNIDTNLPELIGDKDKLIQVVINLISNAVKFTDAGSVSCRVYRQENDLILSVTDTGIGIASQDYDAVFEQFKQVVGDTLTDKPKGTGLGLPICKQIIEHHGGRIWLESELGKGSTFYIALPIVQAEPSSKPIYFNDLLVQLKEQVAHSKLQWIGDAANILIVDDDESIRSLLRQELGDAGYQIEEASNGKEALDKIRVKKPDLIILDIMMPEMNGFDVAAVLKNDPNTMDIPIIVLSVIQDKARGFRIGVDRYLTKPIDTGLLFGEIGSLLEQGKSKKKVMIVDQDEDAVKTLTEVLAAKGYEVTESKEGVLVEDAVNHKPDIIILNATLSDKNNIVQSLRFENGLENVVFLLYQ